MENTAANLTWKRFLSLKKGVVMEAQFQLQVVVARVRVHVVQLQEYAKIIQVQHKYVLYTDNKKKFDLKHVVKYKYIKHKPIIAQLFLTFFGL